MEKILLMFEVVEFNFPIAERKLVNMCELRCDMEGGGWHTRILDDSEEKLTMVQFLFDSIGADGLATGVARTADKLRAGGPPESRISYVRFIESKLLAAGSRMDELIAEFARRLGRGELADDPPYHRQSSPPCVAAKAPP